MRYRRFHYRYTHVVTSAASETVAETWSDHPGVPVTRQQYRPAADLMETATGLEARIELAGVQEADVDVTVYSDALVVEGERCCPPDARGRFHRAEIRYGPFRLVLLLPTQVDVTRAGATYERGILRVELPREEEEEER